MSKQRIDRLLVKLGLAESQSLAAAMVMAGEVSVGERRIDKPGMLVVTDADIHLKTKSPYVSRGGDKLASVMAPLGLDFRGKIILDVGSSTGGFTDVALQGGAGKVFCVDVGNAQLAYKLRQDPRVVVMERTDIRNVERFEIQPDLAVVDVSFISLVKVLAQITRLIKPDGLIVAMMKPQFEASKQLADQHKGLILDESVRQGIIEVFRDQTSRSFEIIAETDSGVAGTHGNRERFYVLRLR